MTFEARPNELVEAPVRLLDDLPLGALCSLTSQRDVIEAAGFTVHHWRPHPPGTWSAYVEVVVEHRGAGIWVAQRINEREIQTRSDAVALLEELLDVSVYPAAQNLPALAHAIGHRTGTTWAQSFDRFGEGWTAGGLLLGCVRLLDEHDAEQANAVRTLLALLDPDLPGLLDRLACWQDNAVADREETRIEVSEFYREAVVALWPPLAGLVDSEIGASVEPDRLLSHPVGEWSTAAAQILVDAVAARSKYVERHLDYAWGVLGRGPYSVEDALASVAHVPGVHIPATV